MAFQTELQRFITESNLEIEKHMGNPTFTWNGNTYTCIPSVAEFKRDLETGGFSIVKLLTATVRRLNCSGLAVFTALPTAQQKITYSIDGLQYRIESIHTDPSGSYFRMIAEGTSKGI